MLFVVHKQHISVLVSSVCIGKLEIHLPIFT